MKSLKIMLLMVVCLSGWSVQATAAEVLMQFVDRYTDLGGGNLNTRQASFSPKVDSFHRGQLPLDIMN
jgi:hypothetical protein